MNTEHETLSRDVENLKHKIAETNQVVVKLEVSLTRKVSDAEEALDTYNNLVSNLGLFPPLPPPLHQQGRERGQPQARRAATRRALVAR